MTAPTHGGKVSMSEPSELRMIDSTGTRKHAVATAVRDKAHRCARKKMICDRASVAAQERAFASDQEVHDWLLAEWEIAQQLVAQRPQHRYGTSQISTDASSDPNMGAKRTRSF